MLELRPQQIRAINATHDKMRAGYKKLLFVIPTGGGKRYCAVWWCKKAQEQHKHVLFVTNRRLLVVQMFEEAERHGVSYGVIMAQTEAIDPEATVQIASLQTLRSRYFKDRLGIATPERMPPADLIIIDECHQDVDAYEELAAFYPNAKVIGLTATPVGSEGRSLVPPYDVMVEEVKNTELITAGLLLPTKVYAPSEPDIQGVKIVSKGEYSQKALGRKVKECTVFADVFNEWAPFADRLTLCFCPGVDYARDLVRQFDNRLGSGKAHLVCADTSTAERDDIFARAKAGSARVLVSVDVLREGFDLPQASCGIDLQPNSQLRTYWQKVGRVKRAFEGQESAVWLDFAGNYWRFTHPNDDPDWELKEGETTAQKTEQRRKEGKESQPLMCPRCNLVRKAGPKCPECGFEAPKAIRRIRMGNGKLKEIPAIAKAKKEKSDTERKLGQWTSLLYGGLTVPRSLLACAKIYHNKTGEWPKDGWPGVAPRDSGQWKRNVTEVFDARKLMQEKSRVVAELNRKVPETQTPW